MKNLIIIYLSACFVISILAQGNITFNDDGNTISNDEEGNFFSEEENLNSESSIMGNNMTTGVEPDVIGNAQDNQDLESSQLDNEANLEGNVGNSGTIQDNGTSLDSLKDWEEDGNLQGIDSSDQNIDMESLASDNSTTIIVSNNSSSIPSSSALTSGSTSASASTSTSVSTSNSTSNQSSNQSSASQVLNNSSICDISNCLTCNSEGITCDICKDGSIKTNEGACNIQTSTISAKCNFIVL